jgi:NitT/TauT family transport system substrate-binding protein
MISRRHLITTAVSAAVAIALSGLPAQSAGSKWRHGIVSAKGDAGFFYMAEKKGFFSKLGLDVEFIELKGTKDLVRAMIAGELDSSDSGPADLLPALEKGANIRIVAGTIVGYPYAMYVRKEINDWKELAGKTFGVSAPGSAPHIFALAMLEKAGVPTDNIVIKNAGGSTGRIKALAAGQLDASAGSTEFVPVADEFGIKVLGQAQDMAPDFPRFVIAMSPKTIETRKDDAAKFLAAYMKGLRYAADHKDETIALSAEKSGEPASDPRFAFSFHEIVDNDMIAFDMAIPKAKIEWLQNMMIRVDQLKGKFDLTPFYDDSLLEEAARYASKL